MSELKIIFTGSVGAGKTQAISLLSEIPIVSTEVKATDEVADQKETTTVGMDYGELTLDDNLLLKLYGTPGQERFSYMWEILSQGALGIMILVDHRREKPLEDLAMFLENYDTFVKASTAVIGITHLDECETSDLEMYYNFMSDKNLYFPIFPIDARKYEDVVLLVESLVAMIKVG